ncbi:TPA: hypothetical protein ACKP2N_006037 [Pseudomonas aeruginosa]|nr:hypothetical protein [Pseudomonas aeruginosa]
MATDLYALAEQVEDEAGYLRFLTALAADWQEDRRLAAASPPPTRRSRSAPARWVGRTAASVASSMPPRPGARTPATACRAIPGRRMPGGARRN